MSEQDQRVVTRVGWRPEDAVYITDGEKAFDDVIGFGF